MTRVINDKLKVKLIIQKNTKPKIPIKKKIIRSTNLLKLGNRRKILREKKLGCQI
jgi:hypothetical protein